MTGVLLVGGASTRFGSPKPLALFAGETLAERAWRMLGDAFPRRLAVGKGDIELPFDVVVEPAAPQAPIGGVGTGAYSRDDLPELERRLAAGDFTLRGVNRHVVQADPRLLANANTPAELSALEQDLAALDEQRA